MHHGEDSAVLPKTCSRKFFIQKTKTPHTAKFVEMSIGNQIRSFVQTVSLTGVHWIVDSSCWAARQLWIVIVVTALFLSVYYSLSVSNSYLRGTSFYVDYSIDDVNVSQKGLVPFPEFVFCLEAPWDIEKSKKINMSIDLLSYMTNLFYPYGRFGKDAEEKQKELDKEYRGILNMNGWNTIELLNNITVSCHQVVKSCSFGLRTFISGGDCCLLLFADPEYSIAGKCFRTTSKFYNITLKEAGSQSILAIKLVIQADILSILNPNIINYPASLSDGIGLAIANNKNHLSTLTSSIIGLVPNSLNSIRVKKVTIDRSDRSSYFGSYHCISKEDNNAYLTDLQGYPAYTKYNCIMAEKQNLILEQYNCSLVFLKVVPGNEYCGPTKTTNIYFER